MAFFVITTPSAPLDPTSYTLVASTPICTGLKDHICYIIASNDGLDRPIIDCTLISQMAIALNTHNDVANVKLKP